MAYFNFKAGGTKGERERKKREKAEMNSIFRTKTIYQLIQYVQQRQYTVLGYFIHISFYSILTVFWGLRCVVVVLEGILLS